MTRGKSRHERGPGGKAMAAACEFRLVGPGEAAILAAVAADCYVPYYAYLWRPGAMHAYLAATYEPARVEAELRDPNVRFKIAGLAGTAAGFSKLELRRDRAALPNAAYLERVDVSERAFGRAVGRMLIARACAAAAAAGRASIWLRAMASSPRPIASYEAAGFEACGTESFEGPGMLDAERPMVVMAKPLESR